MPPNGKALVLAVIQRSLCLGALLLGLAGAAAAQTSYPGFTLYSPNNGTRTYLVDANNAVVHTWIHSRPGGYSSYLLNNGSFELGPPPASAWAEDGVPDCEWIGDFSSAWYVSAYDGTNDYWAGGYCTDPDTDEFLPASSSVTQPVLVPSGNSTLSFHFIAFRIDADDEPADGDRAHITVDDVEVWSSPFVQANNTYPDWTGPITVDLSAYAGQTVSLALGGVSVGTATGNARFDYLEFVPGSTPTTTTSWSTLKSLYR